MSQTRAFVIVEGKVIDPVFYDRLFSSSLPGVDVRSIDTITVPVGLPQRGKQAVLGLFDFYRQQGRLRQGSDRDTRNMLFIVDRDLDGICGRLLRSPHLLYTAARDVEAEVHIHGNVERALGTALSATSAEARDVAIVLGPYITKLADLWRDWLELGALAWSCRYRGRIPFASASAVNDDRFGPLNSSRVHDVRREIYRGRTANLSFSERARFLHRRFRRLYDLGSQHLLIKGKWLPEYVEHVIRSAFGDQTFALNSFGVKFTQGMLDTLDFDGDWADYYKDHIRAVI